MAGKTISQISIAIAADTAKYESSLAHAKMTTTKEVSAMGASLASMAKTSAREFTAAAKASEALEAKHKAIVKALQEGTKEAQKDAKVKSELAKEAVRLAKEEQKVINEYAAERTRATQKYQAKLKERSQAEAQAAAETKKAAEAQARAVKESADKIVRSNKEIANSSKALKSTLADLATGFVAAFSVAKIKSTLDTASAFNTLNQRIKTATKETGDYVLVQESLYKMAIKNGASLADTVSVYQGLARSAKELGSNTTDILTLTDTIQKLGVIGGSSATAMSAGLLQFSQSMSAGVVRAEEWNSIVENMPEVAHRIAVGMSLTDGEIRKVMLSGKLLSKDVMASLLKQAGDIKAEYANMPRSLAQAYEGFATSTGGALAKFDQITGATKSAAAGIDALAKAFDDLGTAAKKWAETEAAPGITNQKILNAQKNKAGNLLSSIGERFADNFGGYTTAQIRQRDARRTKNITAQEEIDLLRPDFVPPKNKKSAVVKGGSGAVVEDKKHGADVNRANDLIASMKAQNAELEAKLRHDDEAITKEKALLKLSKDRTLTAGERNKYAVEINKLAARHAELKKEEAISQEQEKLKAILDGHKEKIALLKNELSGQTEGNALLEANRQIQDAVKVGKVETAAAQEKILAAAREEAVLKDAVKLKGIEESYRQQLESASAKNDKAKELIPIIEAEKKIRDAITAGMGENVAAQQRIRDLARQIADEQLKASFSAEQDKLDKIGASMADENEKLKLKLKGQEHLAKYLDGERDLRKQIADYAKEEADHIAAINEMAGLSESQKSDRIKQVKEGYSSLVGKANSKIDDVRQQAQENTKLNKALNDQDQILQNIKDSTGSYKQKLAELDTQYKQGNITQKQWQKTSEELWKTQTKTNHSLGDGIKQIGNNFTQAILNGTKLNDVLKNTGKALAALAIQKFALEPIANFIDNSAAKLFGTGRYTSKPTLPGTSSQSNNMLGNSLGGAVGSGALSSNPSSGGLLGSLAKMLGIPQFYGGGYYDGGPMVVGERGPEIMWPSSGGYVQNNQSAFGGYGGGYSSNQDNALNSIGEWRQRAQDASLSGRPLSYFELQEGNAKAFDTYKRGLDWSSSDELDLARVMDAIKRAEANDYLENERNTGGGGVNFNWRTVKANEMSQDGMGFARSVEAGGRANFADGNQQRSLLEKAASLNIDVPTSLWNKAGLMADVWDQQDAISGGTAQSRLWYNLTGSYGGSGYKSMGMSGNNLNNSVTGADIWDTNSGGNGAERMDAMGGKEFMWQKFHNFKGAGYENVKDMWSMFHNSNLSFGGGNYVGDPTYGPRQFPGFSGTNADRSKAARGVVDQYGDMDLSKHRPDRVRAWVDWPKFGKYTIGGPIASAQYGGYGSIPRSGLDPSYIPENSGDYTRNALNGLRGRSGETDNRNLNGPRRTWTDGADVDPTPAEQDAAAADEKWMHDYGEKMNLGYSKKGLRAINADGRGINDYQGLKRNTIDFWKNQSSFSKSIPGLSALASSAEFAKLMANAGGLSRIESHINGIGFGGAVGAPGRLSTSGDVFDNYGTAYSGSGRMTDSQRMNSQFRNFADGFDDGHFGAQTGGDTGAWRPKSGWQIKGYRQGVRGYAKGGDLRGGQMALVGEAGPELITTKAASRVIPNDQINNRGGAPVINLINNTGTPMAAPQFKQNSDGSIGLILNAVGANSAKGGSVARGNRQAGRSVNR